MAAEFTGITGHVFTSFPIEELAALGYSYSTQENSTYGSSTARFEFTDSSGECHFIEFECIEDEEKFKKNGGSLHPILHMHGEYLNLPLVSKTNVQFQETKKPLHSTNKKIANRGAVSFLCSSLSGKDVIGTSLEFNSANYFQFSNKVLLIGSYKGPQSEILNYRKESPIWALLIKSKIPNSKNNLIEHNWNGKIVYQLKEAAINFDLFFVPDEFNLGDL